MNDNTKFPKISIIIPTFNHAEFVCEAIDSVLLQNYPNKEVLVVDDGSTDNTKEVLRKYVECGVKYIYKKNGGLSSARNEGIRNASGKFIAFLDADDIWLQDKLLMQYQIISNGDNVGLVGCGYYLVDKNKNILEKRAAKDFANRKKLLQELLLKNVISGSGSGVLIRKECFDEAGVFDETLTCAEDWDMWVRIAKFYEIAFVKDPLVSIRVFSNSMSSSVNAEKMLKNELKVIDKMFKEESFKAKFFVKRKVYSYRYYKATVAFKEVNNREQAKICIFKSFYLYPFYVLNKSYLGILLYVILGNAGLKICGNIKKVSLKNRKI